jgi:hypothetical protein
MAVGSFHFSAISFDLESVDVENVSYERTCFDRKKPTGREDGKLSISIVPR